MVRRPLCPYLRHDGSVHVRGAVAAAGITVLSVRFLVRRKRVQLASLDRHALDDRRRRPKVVVEAISDDARDVLSPVPPLLRWCGAPRPGSTVMGKWNFRRGGSSRRGCGRQRAVQGADAAKMGTCESWPWPPSPWWRCSSSQSSYGGSRSERHGWTGRAWMTSAVSIGGTILEDRALSRSSGTSSQESDPRAVAGIPRMVHDSPRLPPPDAETSDGRGRPFCCPIGPLVARESWHGGRVGLGSARHRRGVPGADSTLPQPVPPPSPLALVAARQARRRAGIGR